MTAETPGAMPSAPYAEQGGINDITAAVQAAFDLLPRSELQFASEHLHVAAEIIGAMSTSGSEADLSLVEAYLHSALQYDEAVYSGVEAAHTSLAAYLTALGAGRIEETAAYTLNDQARAHALRSEWIFPTVNLNRPATIYEAAVIIGLNIIRGIRQGDEVTPERMDALLYGMALEHQVARSLLERGDLAVRRRACDLEEYKTVHNQLIEEGRYADIVGTLQDAEAMSAQRVVNHFTGKLEDYCKQLASPAEGEDAGIVEQPGYYVNLIASVREAASRLDADERAAAYRRLDEVTSRLIDVLFAADKPEYALAFGSRLQAEPATDDFLAKAAKAIRRIRTEVDTDEYRGVREYAVRILPAGMREKFIAAVPREAAYIPPGSHIIRETEMDGSTTLRAIFDQPVPHRAALSNGVVIELPYTNYVVKTLQNYNTDYEREFVIAQRDVEYEHLTDEERAALETVVIVADNNLRRTETLPYYRRLAFKLGEDGVSRQVATVVFKDGAPRRFMNFYPDESGRLRNSDSSGLSMPVKSARPVKDGYMAIPYDGDYLMSNITFRDVDPNFFGPGEDQANAFIVTGSPRVIVSEDDARLMTNEEGRARGRFVIVPVRYYRIEVDRDAEPYGHDR